MRTYYPKLLLLLFLLGSVLFAAFSYHLPFLILLFSSSCILALFFITPIVKKKTIFYIFAFILIEVLVVLMDKQFVVYLYAVLLFLLIECSKDLAVYTFRLLLISLAFINLLIFFFLYSSFILMYLCGSSLIVILLYHANEVSQDYLQVRNAYESLVNEFRIQKRHAYQNEKEARMEERNLIAREMHDAVGHKLTALLMQIELFRIQEKNASFNILKKMASESLEETRKAVRILQEEEPYGISSVLHLIKKLESENTVYVHLTTKKGVFQVSINNRQSAILYRIIQEGLTNAMKYASSKQVFITLSVSPIGHIMFELKNQYVHKHPLHEGFGLENMKKRIKEIGGTLHIYQVEDQFIVQGTMPVEEINI
ncbi:histidine kinase [Niallia sp. NCCP-28]|uniref:sensor histidine kinase n=1 Tax=Niallia sp. NCCP-28 TaxID=2934712 RepID=UPI0020BE1357|nr:histidine kinase [Niallia sp. NCCP-28]